MLPSTLSATLLDMFLDRFFRPVSMGQVWKTSEHTLKSYSLFSRFKPMGSSQPRHKSDLTKARPSALLFGLQNAPGPKPIGPGVA